jgi:hypothetical protein
MGYGSISRAGGENNMGLESQTWNIADGFTKIKILRLLIQLDIDEEIAKFGRKEEMDEIPNEQIPYKRLEGFEKLIFHLRQLIGNSRFSIKQLSDIIELDRLIERIEGVEEHFDGTANNVVNQVTKENELVINESHFNLSLKILHNIKDELNYILNRAGLIFRQGEELDLDDFMRTIEEGG